MKMERYDDFRCSECERLCESVIGFWCSDCEGMAVFLCAVCMMKGINMLAPPAPKPIEKSPGVVEAIKCHHNIFFNEKEAEGMSAKEVRKKWPRGFFTRASPCSMCGYVGIYYDSFAHFVSGDW